MLPAHPYIPKPPNPKTMEHKRLSDLVLEVRMSYDDLRPVLLLSDIHFDHPYCDRSLFFRLMDEALERNAVICFNGDFFCMMQSRGDKRGAKDKILPQHAGANYFNLVIDEAAELLRPYADNILFFGDGNHETAITKWQEINPLDMLVAQLVANTERTIYRMGYHGFVRWRTYHTSGGQIRKRLMYFHHGKYGGAVTMGVLGVKRHGAIIPQADIIWTGHTHDLWHVAHPVVKVKQSGEVVTMPQHHIKTGTFKDEFNRPGGFGVERLNKPAAIGGYWMEIKHVDGKTDISVEFRQAR